MSNELSGQLALTVLNGEFRDNFMKTVAVDQSNPGAKLGTFAIAASPTETSVSFGGISVPGYVLMKHISGSSVEWGPNDSGLEPVGLLQAGEIAFFRTDPSASLRLSGIGGVAEVDIRIYED